MTGLGRKVYALHMSRTNIDIDDELVARAMKKFRLPTKKSAVELALRRLVGPPLTGSALASFLDDIAGTGWDDEPSVFDDHVDVV